MLSANKTNQTKYYREASQNMLEYGSELGEHVCEMPLVIQGVLLVQSNFDHLCVAFWRGTILAGILATLEIAEAIFSFGEVSVHFVFQSRKEKVSPPVLSGTSEPFTFDANAGLPLGLRLIFFTVDSAVVHL